MEVREIAAGEIITEPGFYAMPISWYHDDCCDGPSISSSGLRKIMLESPVHYWDQSYLNPDRDPDAVPEIEADYFRLGRAGHWLMFEPHLYKQNITVRPPMFDSWRTEKAKAWRLDSVRNGFTVLTPEEETRALGVAAALKAHPLVKQGLLGGGLEISMVVKDAKTGIWMKSRPDSIPQEDAFTDLKIAQSAAPRDVERAIRDNGYDMQFALAGICFEKLTQRTIDTFWLVTCESKRPHAIHVAMLSTDATYWARIRIRKALDKMAECLISGDWPAYDEDGKLAAPSKWDIENFTTMQKNALLPQEDDF